MPAPPGYIHDPQPECDYDPGDGAALIPTTSSEPTDRIKYLEAQVLELKTQLARGPLDSAYPASAVAPLSTRSPFSPHSALSTPSIAGPSTPAFPSRHLDRPEIVVPDSAYLSDRPTNLVRPTPIHSIYTVPYPPLDIYFTGWPSDLPDPAELRRL